MSDQLSPVEALRRLENRIEWAELLVRRAKLDLAEAEEALGELAALARAARELAGDGGRGEP